MVCSDTTIHQCVNMAQVCDGKLDCPGGNDESSLCNNDQCSINNGGCSHIRHPSPFGVLCLYQPGFHVRNTTNYKKCEDWRKNSRIERCNMDDQQRLSIMNDSIQMSLGLTFDLICEEVHFIDHHLNYIEIFTYNGENNRRKILVNRHFLYRFMSITLFENYL
ncbi:unnamed protein product [Rotaria sp. Silwood2]|nr:unnamed protein product [Rotaria sp. Silwood2]